MKKQSWITTYNQAEETMTHFFDNNVSCVFKWANKRESLTIEYKGEVMDVFDLEYFNHNDDFLAIPIPHYTDILCRIAEIARAKFGKTEKLKQVRYNV